MLRGQLGELLVAAGPVQVAFSIKFCVTFHSAASILTVSIMFFQFKYGLSMMFFGLINLFAMANLIFLLFKYDAVILKY